MIVHRAVIYSPDKRGRRCPSERLGRVRDRRCGYSGHTGGCSWAGGSAQDATGPRRAYSSRGDAMSRRRRPQAVRLRQADDGLPLPWAVVLIALSSLLVALGYLHVARWAGM
jgi:hypothetical protein